MLGGLLGFLSLGWEMVLFRLLALAHYPFPTTFATALAASLRAWSLGVALAGCSAASLLTALLPTDGAVAVLSSTRVLLGIAQAIVFPVAAMR